MSDAAVAVRKDLISKMLARREIGVAEYLAGREWQRLLEDSELQGGTCYDWDTPLFLQTKLYQTDGLLSEAQCYALDVRRLVREEIGAAAAGDLDRLLSLPVYARVKFTPKGVEYISRLLLVLSVIFDIQGGGTKFGEALEQVERPGFDLRQMKREQPWLFEPVRRKGKLSAAMRRGKAAA